MVSKNLFAIIMSFSILIFACSPMTTGIYDSKNKKKEPFKFLFAGKPEDANKILKRNLVEQGYTFESDDVSSGYLITKPKALNSDECYNTGMADAMMGTESHQSGIIKILYDTLGEKTICTVFPILSMNATYREDAFSKRKLNIEDNTAPQGHPLAMKIKKNILGLQNFTEYQTK